MSCSCARMREFLTFTHYECLTLKTQSSRRTPKDVLIVSLLDGRVVGVDSFTGSILWTFDSGAPLVSMRQSEYGDRMNVFPGVDGGLYAYHGLDESRRAKLEVRLASVFFFHSYLLLSIWSSSKCMPINVTSTRQQSNWITHNLVMGFPTSMVAAASHVPSRPGQRFTLHGR